VKKGDVCEGIIERYDFPNKGSFQVDERKVTIKSALPGQKVKYMVTKKKSGMAEGKVLEVLERSPLEDVEPTCPYFGACGGCAYQTMSYDNQLKLKADMVKALLDRVLLAEDSNSKDYEWEGILGSPSQTAYRNKMEFTFGDAYKDGPLALGLHQKGSFYDILTVDGCEIIGADWSRILTATLAFFSGRNVPFFHRMRHEGILRNLVVRQSRANGQFLINLVTSTQWDAYGFDVKQLLQAFVEMLLELEKSDAFAGSIAGILYTENDALGDVVQSDRMELLYGQDYIEEEILGLKFKISPFSFFQTNTGGCEVLYEKARDYIMRGSVKLDSDKTVFDLYSGTGTIAQMMAAVSKKVIGIEIVEEAVEAAKENAKANGLSNCEFIAGDVLKAIDLVDEKPDLIIVDPPRDGIHPKALEKILAFGVGEIVYISCKPTSLARDLETIIRRGYHVDKVCCVDQFPRTSHVETVVLLSQQKPDDTIEIDLDLDELDATSAETKATYQEIKDYVLKEFGLKVSNLYISQIKRKCGIEVGENYNLPKTENPKVPQCPKEKEDAIKAALKYFAMI
jgi:23S rRNA (uracil1939-C5)-methyltransferase